MGLCVLSVLCNHWTKIIKAFCFIFVNKKNKYLRPPEKNPVVSVGVNSVIFRNSSGDYHHAVKDGH